jgi:uncharacterized membrane protein
MHIFFRPTLSTPFSSRRKVRNYRKNIPEEEQEAFKRLGVLATQKWELERSLVSQMRLQNLLEAWLYVHLPVSVALMVAVLLHIIIVFYYGYRVL